MTKQSQSRSASSEANSFAKTIKGENLGYSQIFEQIASAIPFAHGMIVSTMLRGGLQIAQPQRLPDNVVRGYSKGLHAYDRVTWRTIEKGRAVKGAECWPSGGFEASAFYSEFMADNGFRSVIAAPLTSPVFDGYPGAIHLYRRIDQGAFTEHDLAELTKIAKKLDAAIAQLRGSRRARPTVITDTLKHPKPYRYFIFDKNLKALPVGSDPKTLDDRLRQQMLQHAKQKLERSSGAEKVSAGVYRPSNGDRLPLADSNGDLWNFRIVSHRSYPALGDGPFVFFCLAPVATDWSLLRPGDFIADSELSRLIPAIRFMEQEFARGPGLGEISKSVHLSSFHFHRRFSELLGITPKHFMLDCQMDECKRQLLSREVELADIAKTCGFAHQSHFTSRFKQAAGLTPTRWRRFAFQQLKSIPQ